MYKNSEILSAILNKWAQPLVSTFLNSHLQSMPFIQSVQHKIRNMGWVSPNWSLFAELSPLMESMTGGILTPIMSRYISQIDEAAIPKMAHSIVEEALKNGELSLFEGKVTFEEADLKELKRLLDLNLPYNPSDYYQVLTEEPTNEA